MNTTIFLEEGKLWEEGRLWKEYRPWDNQTIWITYCLSYWKDIMSPKCDNLTTIGVVQLRGLARKNRLMGYSRLKKLDLIAKLRKEVPDISVPLCKNLGGLKVVQLRGLAKRCRLTRYSCLKKADLIAMLREKCPDIDNMMEPTPDMMSAKDLRVEAVDLNPFGDYSVKTRRDLVNIVGKLRSQKVDINSYHVKYKIMSLQQLRLLDNTSELYSNIRHADIPNPDDLLKLAKSFLEIYPKTDDCCICLSTTDTRTVCGHFVHKACIDEWAKLNPTCPLCRDKI